MSIAAPSLGAGAMLGFFFYGGLWLTATLLPGSQRPVRIALGSFLFRACVVTAALSWFAASSAVALALALTAFLGMRRWLVHLASRT